MVDRSEIEQMAKFMTVINGHSDDAPTGAIPTASRPSDPAVAQMKAILERFHDAAENVVTEAPMDRELREALMTESTEHGARIGPWEIRLRESGKRTLYDVVNIINEQPLARDLLLYEAAHGLVRILNDGGRINSAGAIELLRAEQEYGSRVQDMVVFKHGLTKNPHSPRMAVLEARYGEAKRRALAARERVCKLSECR